MKKGFTLVELLVVIAIIALLASIVSISFSGVRARARDARRISDMQTIHTAMQACFDDSTCGAPQAYVTTTGGANAVQKIGTYLDPVPQDPLNRSPYQYTWVGNTTDPTRFCVYVQLENGRCAAASHKGVCTTLTTCPGNNNLDCWSSCPP